MRGAKNGLSIEEISRGLCVSRNTATKYLDSLFVSGQVNMRKAGPAKVYTLSARLPAEQILSQSSDMILILDGSNSVRDVNGSFLQAFGIKKDDVMGRDIATTPLGPGLIDRIRDPVRQAMAGKEAVVNAWIPVQKEWRAFRIRIHPLAFSWGDRGIVVMMEDRTGEILAQEENALLAELLNASPTAITVLDFSGKYLYSNEKNLELHGYSEAEFLRLNIHDLDNPDSREEISWRLEEIKKSGELAFEVVHFHKDGRQIPLDVQSKIASWGDREVIISTATDISERKQAERALRESEETFRAMVEQSSEGICIVDFSGTILFANERSWEIAGYPEEMRTVGMHSVFDCLAPELRENAARDILQVSRGIDGHEVYYKILAHDSGERWLACIGRRISFHGTPAMLLSFRDVTGRKRAEEELRESEQKFSTLFGSNPVPITVVSAADGVFVDVNDAFLRETGYSRSEVIGKTAGDLQLFTDAEAYVRMVSALRDLHQIHGMEMQCRIKDGAIRTCLFSSSLITMNGRPHLLSTIKNITERKAAESAFQAMVTGMLGTTGTASLDRITESIACWLKADIVLIGEILPDRERVQVLSAHIDGRIVSGFSYILTGTPCENTAERGFCLYPDHVADLFPESKDLGRHRIRGYAGTPLRNYDGTIVGVLCIMTRDLLVLPPSARKIIDIIAVKATAEIGRLNSLRLLSESEEKFRNLVEYSFSGTVILDPQGTILFANRAAGEIVEAENYTLMIGVRNVLEFIAPESREDALRDFGQVARGIDGYPARYRLTTTTGRERWVESIGKTIAFHGAPAIIISLRQVSGPENP